MWFLNSEKYMSLLMLLVNLNICKKMGFVNFDGCGGYYSMYLGCRLF